MRIFIAFVMVLAVLPVQAQEEMGGIALKYPFLDTSANHLQFFGSDKGMEKFYEKLDRAIFEQEGKVNVVHMGG